MTEPPALARILVLDDLLAPAECQALVEQAIATGFAPARLGAEGRHNDEAFVVDVALADRIEARLRRLVTAAALEVDDLFEVYRYTTGQRIDVHEDGGRAIRRGARSNCTVVTYLSGNCGGGRTLFPEDGLGVEPVCGRAVLFRHGIPHLAEAVEAGTKLVARSDVSLTDL